MVGAVGELRDPAELVSTETFAKLVRYATEHHHVHRFYAAEGVRQGLIYLYAVCTNPGVRLVPDVSVDPFWHDFLMHTQEYDQFCRDHNGGNFLHHVPIMLKTSSPAPRWSVRFRSCTRPATRWTWRGGRRASRAVLRTRRFRALPIRTETCASAAPATSGGIVEPD